MAAKRDRDSTVCCRSVSATDHGDQPVTSGHHIPVHHNTVTTAIQKQDHSQNTVTSVVFRNATRLAGGAGPSLGQRRPPAE